MNDNNATQIAAAYPDDNPKTLLGVTKVPLHLVPPVATQVTAEAFADGAAKYGPYNWREKTVSASIYVAAAKRHIDAWWDGEELSRDAQVLHLGHALACLAIIVDALSIGKLNDDRPPKGVAADWQQRYADKNSKGKNGTERKEKQGTNRSLAGTAVDGPSDSVEHGRVSDLQADLQSGYAKQLAYGSHSECYYYTSDGGIERYDSEGNRCGPDPTTGRFLLG